MRYVLLGQASVIYALEGCCFALLLFGLEIRDFKLKYMAKLDKLICRYLALPDKRTPQQLIVYAYTTAEFRLGYSPLFNTLRNDLICR